MAEAVELVRALVDGGVDALLHVPDSLLAPCLRAAEEHSGLQTITTNNEGEALAMAVGMRLAGGSPCVLLQNSGLGNLVNPLTSLSSVLEVPVLLLVGWRGQPGTPDEPQHELMGAQSAALLELLGVRVVVVDSVDADVRSAVREALATVAAGRTCALLISRRTFGSGPSTARGRAAGLTRTQALRAVLDVLPEQAAVVATTGHTARELCALGDRPQQLYVVGAMGCASSVALGVSLRAELPVVVLDGDGAALMRLEAWVSIGAAAAARRLLHVLLDNQAHDSTGGQPTLATNVDFCAVASAVGYASASTVTVEVDLQSVVAAALSSTGPHLVHVPTSVGSPAELPRPARHPRESARRFARHLAAASAGGRP